MDDQIEEMDLDSKRDIIQQFLSLYGVQQQKYEPADADETYAIFTAGDFADKEFKRIPKPSYNQQEEVARVMLKAHEDIYPGQAKRALCKHHGIDEEEIKSELSQKQVDQKVLPLICREDLPDGWDIGDVSSAEVERMRIDFLSDT